MNGSPVDGGIQPLGSHPQCLDVKLMKLGEKITCQSAQTWCTGKTQRDRVEREMGGGIGMGNTCISMADSCLSMTKTTTIL